MNVSELVAKIEAGKASIRLDAENLAKLRRLDQDAWIIDLRTFRCDGDPDAIVSVWHGQDGYWLAWGDQQMLEPKP